MIATTRADSAAVLTMAHGKANAFDSEFLAALRQALGEALRSDARALVITARDGGSGNPGIFSAGVDLLRIMQGDRSDLAEFLAQLSDALGELFAAPKPVVAAVNGHAIAGGAILAWACDYRLMARGSGRIGVPELRVGVPFPMVPAEIIRHSLGHLRAHRAMLVGQVVEAGRAVEEGFVDEVVEPEGLMARALAVARSLGSAPAASYARTKTDLRRPVLETWGRLRAAHDRETLDAWDSAEVRAAIKAYVEKTLKK
jgi:enoyl-CoA hydratase